MYPLHLNKRQIILVRAARDVIRRITNAIVISIIACVVAEVISANIWTADDIRSRNLRDVPLVVAVVCVCRVIEVVVVNRVVARRVQVDAIAIVRACVVAHKRVVVRRPQVDAVVIVRGGNILYPRNDSVCKKHTITVVHQSQISNRYVCGTHDSDKASIARNFHILLTNPVIDRFSIYCVARIYVLSVG